MICCHPGGVQIASIRSVFLIKKKKGKPVWRHQATILAVSGIGTKTSEKRESCGDDLTSPATFTWGILANVECGQEAKYLDYSPRSTIAETWEKQHRAFDGDHQMGEIK